MKTPCEALIFDMDDAMIDSMPWHACTWVEFSRRRLRQGRCGVASERCIVFEDAPFAIEAARRGGMRALTVCSWDPALELAGPHVMAVARDYAELFHSNFLETLDVATA